MKTKALSFSMAALTVPYTVMRLSTGLFVDSETSPDKFVPDEFV